MLVDTVRSVSMQVILLGMSEANDPVKQNIKYVPEIVCKDARMTALHSQTSLK